MLFETFLHFTKFLVVFIILTAIGFIEAYILVKMAIRIRKKVRKEEDNIELHDMKKMW